MGAVRAGGTTGSSLAHCLLTTACGGPHSEGLEERLSELDKAAAAQASEYDEVEDGMAE